MAVRNANTKRPRLLTEQSAAIDLIWAELSRMTEDQMSAEMSRMRDHYVPLSAKQSRMRMRTIAGIKAAHLGGARCGGKPKDAALVLRQAASDLRNGVPLSQPVRVFLATALEAAIAKPEKAGRALGLIVRGAPEKSNWEQMWWIGFRFDHLRKEVKRRGYEDPDQEKGNDDTAIALLASEFKISRRTVRRRLTEYSNLKRAIDESIARTVGITQPRRSSGFGAKKDR